MPSLCATLKSRGCRSSWTLDPGLDLLFSSSLARHPLDLVSSLHAPHNFFSRSKGAEAEVERPPETVLPRELFGDSLVRRDAGTSTAFLVMAAPRSQSGSDAQLVMGSLSFELLLALLETEMDAKAQGLRTRDASSTCDREFGRG
jgi:hypothetical protein